MKPVKLYSFHCNRPDLIEFQKDSIKRFLMDDSWELIIVNNSHSPEHRAQITQQCTKFGLQEIVRVPQTPPGFAHSEAMNYVWQNHMLQDKGCYSAFLDGDMFAISEFSVNEFMAGHIFGGGKQQREHTWHWISPLLMIADVDLVPDGTTIDWIGGTAPNGTTLDTGGGMHRYLDSHPEVKAQVKAMTNSWYVCKENNNRHVLPDELQGAYQDEYTIEIIHDSWVHYARSSNYDHKDNGFHARKTSFIRAFVYGCISNKIKAKKTGFMMPNDTYFGWGKWV